MTSRPPMGVPPRQPTRTLSASGGLNQRPPHQRTLSQQYLPPSPIRRETFSDLSSPDSSDVAQGRAQMFRRGGSRLKLELSNEHITHDPISESPNALDASAKPFTPSRMMPLGDSSDAGDMSPRNSTQPPTAADSDTTPLPMPQRRKRFSMACPRGPCRKATTAPAAVPKKDVRPKPWNVEVPPAAPRFRTPSKAGTAAKPGTSTPSTGKNDPKQLSGYCDFFPWTGGHAEDRFSDSIIRNGFFDKAPVSGTETSSAKASLFPMLKNKSGLHMLSSLFTGILNQRRLMGQVNPESTFKLPPRVTVTDTRREAWLKDIANPEIPVKRLSRTIPHGVKGKVLLEQCTNKNIPLDRAIWLARCVGAQEMRTFKRKGVNGAVVLGSETKWIRDWTVCIEQFIETRISAFNEADWKVKVQYAIRLATNLYSEHLLDREHYMDWLITSLENSNQARLPMWLLLVQIYWRDLLSLRRAGRRLAFTLLGHLSHIYNSPDKDILAPLLTRLTQLMTSVLTHTPDNLVSPTVWPKFRDVLASIVPGDNELLTSRLRSIDMRNEQLVASCVRSKPAAQNTLVKQLDLALQIPMTSEMATQCWTITTDKSALVKTLLAWCTSIYRPGLTKVYVSARLLASWSRLGVDVTDAILDFIDSDPLEEAERKKMIYHLVSELVRSNHFVVSRYGQWLIARGGLLGPDVAPEGPASTRLLAELPTHALSDALKSLRASLLQRARYMEFEEKNTPVALSCVRCALGMPLEEGDPMMGKKPMPTHKLADKIRLSSRTLKTEVGAWLWKEVARGEHNAKQSGGVFELAPTTFHALRVILEAAEDFWMFARVLKVVARVSNVDILGCCVDIVNLHLTTFAAVGAARDLFDTLYARLKSVAEDQGIAARPLLSSLANLAPRIPGLEALGQQLQMDLTRNDRSTAVSACSPVSDTITARLQDAEGELHEEIEKLLSTGTSMDKGTMERLFGTVAERLQSCWGKADERQRAYSGLLTRLRLFDPQHFDTIMTKWLQRIRVTTERPSILQIYPVLVSLECLSMSLILSTASDASAQKNAAAAKAKPGAATGPASIVQNTWRTKYVQEVLQLLTAPISEHPLLTVEECYRFSIVQNQTRRMHLHETLSVVRTALLEYSVCRQRNIPDLPLDNADNRAQFLEILRSLVLLDPASVARAFAVRNADGSVASLIEATTTKLLLPSAPDGTQVSFDQVLELTNDLTLPFCQLKLSSSLAVGDSSGPDAGERLQTHLEMFGKAMDRAIDAKNITWTGMLSSLGPEITQQLKNTAQSRLFEVIPSLKSPPPMGRSVEQSVRMAQNLLSVVDAIIRGGSMGRPPQLVPAMVDKLGDVWAMLSAGDADAKHATVTHWLPIILTFITLHTATFDTSKASNEVRARALLALSGILQELDSFPTTFPPPGPEQSNLPLLKLRVFDLALLLVDNLADDARQQCVRALADATSDPRLRYLFSFAPQPNEHLMLSHRDKPLPPGAAAAAAAANANNSAATGAGTGASGQMTPTATPTPGGRAGGGGAAPAAGNVRAGFLGPAGMWGQQQPERLSKFQFRRWDAISDLPSKSDEVNDSSLNLSLFEAIKL